jgi:hypothetical protein
VARLSGRLLFEEPADVERLAVAAGGGLQPVAHGLSAGDEGVDVGQLAQSELADRFGRRGAVVGRGQQDAGLVEREARGGLRRNARMSARPERSDSVVAGAAALMILCCAIEPAVIGAAAGTVIGGWLGIACAVVLAATGACSAPGRRGWPPT